MYITVASYTKYAEQIFWLTLDIIEFATKRTDTENFRKSGLIETSPHFLWLVVTVGDSSRN